MFSQKNERVRGEYKEDYRRKTDRDPRAGGGGIRFGNLIDVVW